MRKGGIMKKLFAIAIAASMLSGLYGLSFGLGGRYTLSHPGALPDSTFSYPSIVADVMCKPLPILGFRIGLVGLDLIPDDEGGTQYRFGTGTSASILIYIPMAGMVQPYIPFHVLYMGDGGSTLTLDGGLGAEFMFGGFGAYLEGGIDLWSYSPEVGDSSSDTWFHVQGGVRIPVNL
jgi:hypothetical protein